VLDGTVFTGRFRIAQGTGIPAAFVSDEGCAALVGVLEGHGQACVTQGKSVVAKGALLSTASSGQGNSGETTGIVKVLVDIESIEGGIKGPEARPMAQASLNIGQERAEIADIGLVEGLGQLSQDEFTPTGNLGCDNAGAVAPVELANAGSLGWNRIGNWGRQRLDVLSAFSLVGPALAAKTTVRVAVGLFGLVVAILDVGFVVVVRRCAG